MDTIEHSLASGRDNCTLAALSARLAHETARRERGEQHQRLQLEIADSLRCVTDCNVIAARAFRLLSGFLPVARINYAELDSTATRFVVRHAWGQDGACNAGVSGATALYGSAIMAALCAGKVVTIDDVSTDARTRDHGAAYAGVDTRACMLVPMLKGAQLAAVLSLQQSVPSRWDPEHVPLVRDIAERIWNAMEQAEACARQREAEQALQLSLRAESERLRALLESLDVTRERLGEGMLAGRMALWDWDLATEQITFSQNTAAVFGATWSCIADVWNAVCEEDLERLTLAGEAAEATCGTYEEVVRIKRPGGAKPLWLQIHGKFIADQDGKPCTVRSVAIDVTGLKCAQQALRDADARKDEFLAMLAHELRNPLAPIRAGAQLLSMVYADSDQVQRTGVIIARQVDHMSALIDELLDVARVTSGLTVIAQAPVDVASMVGEAAEQVMPLMQQRDHQLTIDECAGAPQVLGDRKRLVQVLANLLQNAATYTPPHGHVRISISQADGEVAIAVSDDGVGMDAQLLPHVFELFSQEKRALDRSQGGLGLGLALVQRLVALHGGRVVAASAGAHCGSVFTVLLPTLSPGLPAAS